MNFKTFLLNTTSLLILSSPVSTWGTCQLWSGTGTLSSPQESIPCENVFLEVCQNNTPTPDIRIGPSVNECSGRYVYFYTITLALKGSELFFNSERVGYATGRGIYFQVLKAEKNQLITFNGSSGLTTAMAKDAEIEIKRQELDPQNQYNLILKAKIYPTPP